MTKHSEKRKTISNAPAEHPFYIQDGPILWNLQELCEALTSTISKEQFHHHVTNDRNDFANWIREVLKDTKCANALKRVKTQQTSIKTIERCLQEYI